MGLITPYWGLDGLIIFTSLLVAAYMYMTRKFKYWSKRGVMEVPPTPFFGNFSQCFAQRKAAAEFLKDMYNFSGDDLVVQAAIFFSAGYETSSTTISFTLYELAVQRDVQTTLRKEIQEALAKTDGKISYEMITTLPYLDMVVSETLRKYPPLAFLDRICNQNYKVPNSDLVIEKGTPIFIPMLGLHYDPEFYPDPDKYDPLRFTDENKKNRPNFSYLPFGDGPRDCIGLRLGLMQSKLGIFQVIRRFEVTPCEKTKIPMPMDPRGLTTTALGGMYLNIQKISEV